MKVCKQATAAMLVMMAIFAMPAGADEAANNLENALHDQVFMELRDNVKSLFKSVLLINPGKEIAPEANHSRFTPVSGDSISADTNSNVALAGSDSSVR